MPSYDDDPTPAELPPGTRVRHTVLGFEGVVAARPWEYEQTPVRPDGGEVGFYYPANLVRLRWPWEPPCGGSVPGHVACDIDCGALLEPVTPGQMRAAYLHWRGHGCNGGCAHGN